MAKETLKCLYCGEEFKKNGKKKFCSKICATYNSRLIKTGKKPNKREILKVCKNCHNKIPKGRFKFCSKKCSLQYSYKILDKQKRKIYYINNREKILDRTKKNYYKKRKSRLKKGKEWRNKNRKSYNKKRREHLSNRRKVDKQFRIKRDLRRRLCEAMTTYSNGGKVYSSKHYGIDYKAIIEHLKPFPKEISKYHIDHIKPLCSFDLEDPEEVKKAFAPENHQWLTIEENLKKGGKYGEKNEIQTPRHRPNN